MHLAVTGFASPHDAAAIPRGELLPEGGSARLRFKIRRRGLDLTRFVEKTDRRLENADAFWIVQNPFGNLTAVLYHIFKKVAKIAAFLDPLNFGKAETPRIGNGLCVDKFATVETNVPVRPLGLCQLEFGEVSLDRGPSLTKSVNGPAEAV